MKNCENCRMYEKIVQDSIADKGMYLRELLDYEVAMRSVEKKAFFWKCATFTIFMLAFLFVVYLGKRLSPLVPMLKQIRQITQNENGFFPMSYEKELKNIVGVGAIKENETMVTLSNYGKNVTTLAPGQKILTTKKGGGYGYLKGTSAAAPLVTGGLVLLKAKYPDKTMEQILQIFKKCHRKKEALKGKSKYGILDFSKCADGV